MEYNQAKNVLWHQESEVTKAQLVEEMENLLDELPEEDTKEILEDITDDHSKTVQEWTQ